MDAVSGKTKAVDTPHESTLSLSRFILRSTIIDPAEKIAGNELRSRVLQAAGPHTFPPPGSGVKISPDPRIGFYCVPIGGLADQSTSFRCTRI